MVLLEPKEHSFPSDTIVTQFGPTPICEKRYTARDSPGLLNRWFRLCRDLVDRVSLEVRCSTRTVSRLTLTANHTV
jgi:hypothetical protein